LFQSHVVVDSAPVVSLERERASIVPGTACSSQRREVPDDIRNRVDRRLELLGLSIRKRDGKGQAPDHAQTVSQSTASIGPIRPTTRN
jgi:hypothetical protein